ncbi:ABC transporter ATP-binding protein [Rhizobium rhizoryzae]|uniref:Peptide/nickel transport system ATP-binding protein n=1 Tax=Rhizobium rhizoryzae TaxID=451876 RepID=A0A7W6PTU1_9HYPH|nr:ABC transporter ATP-binding protein [Rhizobium rhizoryzae]MBB4145125.1 peptide/nickel transport system ATP-binding protein [Rhizobium rhizoryzae]
MSVTVDVKNLSISFGDGPAAVKVLPDVSFSVNPGECFGLVGESGSGKSTVLRCISMLTDFWKGEILIDGRSVRDIPLIQRCRMLQMVFQDPYGSLHPRQSVRTVLHEPLVIHKLGDREERMRKAITDVGLPIAFLDRFPHQLSGGQRQRVAIARALILEPSLLLLDEPTSALDVSVQAEILNLLQRLQKERGFTYIMVTHDLAVVDHMCDRFAVMLKGEVTEILPRDAIAENRATHPYARELVGASLAYEGRA